MEAENDKTKQNDRISVIDDKAKYTDWNKRDDIKSDLHFDLIVLLDEWGYPPIDLDEVYKDIFEQAENFKRNVA